MHKFFLEDKMTEVEIKFPNQVELMESIKSLNKINLEIFFNGSSGSKIIECVLKANENELTGLEFFNVEPSNYTIDSIKILTSTISVTPLHLHQALEILRGSIDLYLNNDAYIKSNDIEEILVKGLLETKFQNYRDFLFGIRRKEIPLEDLEIYLSKYSNIYILNRYEKHITVTSIDNKMIEEYTKIIEAPSFSFNESFIQIIYIELRFNSNYNNSEDIIREGPYGEILEYFNNKTALLKYMNDEYEKYLAMEDWKLKQVEYERRKWENSARYANYYPENEEITEQLDDNSSDWREDAAGSSDENTMNDVYWNLD